MAETWYLRDAAGAACGTGTRKSLNQTAGTAAKEVDVEGGTGETWNRTESPSRSIQAGTWSVILDIRVDSGGGPANKVQVNLTRRNSACAIQQTIIDAKTATLTKGATNTDITVSASPGQVDFADGDILVLELSDGGGNLSKFIRYDGAGASDADSRLTHPDELTGSTFFQTIAATAAGIAGLDKGLFMTIASTATGIAVLTTIKIFPRTIAVVATGITALAEAVIFPKTVAVAAIGVVSIVKSVGKNVAVAATGVVGIIKTVGKPIAVTAIGVPVLSSAAIFPKTISTIATGIATVAEVFIVAATAAGSIFFKMLRKILQPILGSVFSEEPD